MQDIAAILAKPEDFGFHFVLEVVHKLKKASTPGPIAIMDSIPLFEAAFPGLIVRTENGQSIRVNTQRVVRDAWFAGDKDVESLKARVVRWMLGIEQPTREVVVEKFTVLIDGEWITF